MAARKGISKEKKESKVCWHTHDAFSVEIFTGIKKTTTKNESSEVR